MFLRDVKTKEDLEILYRERGLETIEDKIVYLISGMNIRAMSGYGKDLEGDLAALEEVAIMGLWPAFSRS